MHRLHPFSDSPFEKLVVDCQIIRESDILLLTYIIEGDSTFLLLPEQVVDPRRKDELWMTTCFELFLKPDGDATYFEFNLAPDGCWNLYRFSDYREGMTTFPCSPPQLKLRDEQGKIFLDCTISLDRLVKPGQEFTVGCSCVLEHFSGTLCYRALCHPGAKPDFHNSHGFVVTL